MEWNTILIITKKRDILLTILIKTTFKEREKDNKRKRDQEPLVCG